jgi:hypothetical protein
LLANANTDLENQNLVRVHPSFRVIALGVPVPPYPGRTLDPPLRSRFQARRILPLSPGNNLETLFTPMVPLPTLERVVGLVEATHVVENMHDGASQGERLPHFSSYSLSHCIKILSAFPSTPLERILSRVFPVHLCAAEHEATYKRIRSSFFPHITTKEVTSGYSLARHDSSTASLSLHENNSTSKTLVACGAITDNYMNDLSGYVEIPGHKEILVDMLKVNVIVLCSVISTVIYQTGPCSR